MSQHSSWSTIDDRSERQIIGSQRDAHRTVFRRLQRLPYRLASLLNVGIVVRPLLADAVKHEFHARCVVGEKLQVTDQARCYNHSGDPSRIVIGRGVVIDGIIQCCERGRLTIGDYAIMGRSRVYCAELVKIGSGALISDCVGIMDSDLHSRRASERLVQAQRWADGGSLDSYSGVRSKPVVIESHVWIGFGACILKGVTLGEGCIVGAGSVVTTDVAPWTIVAGNPAHVIGALDTSER